MSSVTFVTTPSAPRLTTRARERAWRPSSRENVSTSPSAVTSSSADTAVERLPFFTPEPCVPVAHAPAIEMCGSDARLCSAKPLLVEVRGTTGRSSCPLRRSPCARPGSSAVTWFISLSESSCVVLSAIPLKQWRVPSTLNCACCLTNVLHLLQRPRAVEAIGAVPIVAGPIDQRLVRRRVEPRADPLSATLPPLRGPWRTAV